MALRLIEPSADFRASFLAAEAEFAAEAGGERIIDVVGGPNDEFDAYVRRLMEIQGRQPAQPNWVPMSVYWIVDDDRYVGRVNLRHRLNRRLRRHGGHIGYEIRPSMRRRGYASRGLALALDKARQLRLRRVLLTCDDDNVGSIRVIEANGGQLEGRFTARSEAPFRRYWIDLRHR
jgi:predicted acetyltransferase